MPSIFWPLKAPPSAIRYAVLLPTPEFRCTPPLSWKNSSSNQFALVILSGSPNSVGSDIDADHAEAGALTDLPAVRRGVVRGAVGQVDELAHDVGQRLVDRAGLPQVGQSGGVLGDAVGQLVAGHVVGADAFTEGHLLAVPERVGERAAAVDADPDGAAQRLALAVAVVGADQVGQVGAERLVGVGGVAEVLVDLVDVDLAGRGLALAAGRGEAWPFAPQRTSSAPVTMIARFASQITRLRCSDMSQASRVLPADACTMACQRTSPGPVTSYR